MRWQLIVMALAASTSLAMSQAPAGKSDLDALQGVWRLTSGEMMGEKMSTDMTKDVTLTIKGNVSNYKNKDQDNMANFKLDESKTPKQIDITDQKSGMAIMIGIDELKGDEFKVCLDGQGKMRPTEFKSSKDSDFGVLIFKREKK